MSATESISTVEVEDVIGQGHFGVVHRGNQQPNGIVAVKVIDCAQMKAKLGVSQWSTLLARLNEEAESLRKGEHPTVVRVHGVGYAPDKSALHIVTELCEGSLADLSKLGPMDSQFARRSIEDALHGLEVLHTRGMIHRDLKSPNLLHKNGRTKIADFGFVTDQLVAGYAFAAGYATHLAPEVHRENITSFKTDVWAIGLTIYRIVNGEPWYAEELLRLGVPEGDKSALTAFICAGGFASKLHWMPHVPDSLRRLVRRAMHDDPRRRFASGGEMLTSFQTLVRPIVEPAWSCAYGSSLTSWTAPLGDTSRNLRVEWHRASSRKNRVVAWSEPTSGGRRHTFMAKSDLSRVQALGHLDKFFASRTTK